MNPRTCTWVAPLLLVVICAGSLAAQVPDKDTAKSKILALENIWNRAEALGDLKTLDVLFDNDLIYIDPDGALLTKTQFLAHDKLAPLLAESSEITNIQIFDDTAIVNGTYNATMMKHGKMVVFHGRFTDTWMYKNATWVCVAAQATPILAGVAH